MKNYYKVLELEFGCSSESIKKSFRKLSLKYHPDKNRDNDSNKFVEINEAYEILSDPQKRELYDSQWPANSNNSSQNDFKTGMDSIFSNLFKNMGNKSDHMYNQLSKPPPIIKSLEISIESIYKEQHIPMEVERWISDGLEKNKEMERIYIDIPEGIDNNELIIIRDKGNINEMGISGDIKIFIKIENNSQYFKRNGLDLEMTKEISLREAICGFTFEIFHINGKKYAIKNEKGKIIYPGFKKVINNLGIKRNDIVGNLIIIFDVKFPETINPGIVDKLNRLLTMNEKSVDSGKTI